MALDQIDGYRRHFLGAGSWSIHSALGDTAVDTQLREIIPSPYDFQFVWACARGVAQKVVYR